MSKRYQTSRRHWKNRVGRSTVAATLVMFLLSIACHQVNSLILYSRSASSQVASSWFVISWKSPPGPCRRQHSAAIGLGSVLSLFPHNQPNHAVTIPRSVASTRIAFHSVSATTPATRHVRQQRQQLSLSSIECLTGERVRAILEGHPASSTLLSSSSSQVADGSLSLFSSSSKPALGQGGLDQLKVKDLRLELSTRGMDTKGRKGVLRSRLQSVLEAEGNNCELGSTTDEEEVSPAQNDNLRCPKSNMNIGPLSVDAELPYILRVCSHVRSSYGGVGVGMGLYSFTSGEEIWSGRAYLEGDRCMFEADYTALLLGFDFATSVLRIRKLYIQIENDVLIRQLHRTIKVSKPKLRAMMEYFHSQEEELRSSKKIEWVETSHVSSEETGLELSLAQKALATRKSSNLLDDEWSALDPLEIARMIADDSMSTTSAEEELPSIDIDVVEGDQTTSQTSIVSSPSLPEPSARIDPSKVYLLQFDGGSRGNPGIAGAGMVLYEVNDDGIKGEEVWCGWKYHSERATNNLAEYLGLLCGLKCARSLGVKRLIVEGDSQLVVRHMTGQYQCREETLKEFYLAAIRIAKNDLDSFVIRHIRRAENNRADSLANHAMDTRGCGGFV